jgi:rhodanese-related sulfurtransferase
MGIISFITSCVRYFSSDENIQNLSVDDFEKQIIATNGEQLIDVCYPREFAKHHIEGARSINFRSPDFREQIDKLDRNKPILLYCAHGVRSKLTASMCRKMGFKTIYDLDKGLVGWMKEGRWVVCSTHL